MKFVRKAQENDLDQIYMMGFDVWSDGASTDEYLESCRQSSKYKRGTWYVLTNGAELLSSLIIYNLDSNQIGIGSIATPLTCRNLGHASQLINAIIAELDKTFNQPTYFLYADISPEFYEKFGFSKLEQPLQKYKESSCMIRQGRVSLELTEQTVPKYF